MAANSPIELVVITPERKVLETPVEQVVLPAHDGEVGILRGRAPLMCELGIGQLRYTRDRQTWRMFVEGGFAQVLQDHVTVLTTQAIPAEAITEETVRAAEEAMQQHKGHDAEARAARDRARRRWSVLRRLRVGR
jgi:F-type H+-transporting ATPase subunit epsilon